MREQQQDFGALQTDAAPVQQEAVPGKSTLVEREYPGAFASSPMQLKAEGAPTPGKRRRGAANAGGGGGGDGGGGGGGGQGLPDGVRGKMESSFGADFSGVRVHEGGQAAEMGALAYAQGDDIHMAPGQYDPDSQPGQELLGHELSHVVQQREGRVPGGEGQGKDGAVVVDAGLEAEADREGAAAAAGMPARAPSTATGGGGDAPIQGKGIIQMRPNETPAGAVAASHSFAVPPVTDIGAILDPVQRNQAINTGYHAIDRAMTGYMGDPLVSNWFTYGQHASREAGTQIRNLQMGLGILRDIVPTLRALTFSNPFTMISDARAAIRTIQRVIDLMQQDDMLKQAMQLAFMRAGITEAELMRLVAEAQHALEGVAFSSINPLGLSRVIPFIGHVTGMVGRLIAAIPAIITSVEHVYANMVQGNREIYENVAPAAAQFLSAAQGAPDGRVGAMAFRGDGSGFLAAAFAEYVEVRVLGDEARAAPGTPEAAQKLAQRQAKAAHANLLVGMQEQLVILQPIFDTMQAELRAMSGTMTLHDPNGAHPLANDWGNFYTRMGIDPATAPSDPRTITPGNLPPLLPLSQRQGTISQYFGDNVTNEKIHEAPPTIAPG